MTGHVTVLVGTSKGVFLLESDAGRKDWDLRGPFCDGWPINHVIGCTRTGTLWAAAGSASNAANAAPLTRSLMRTP